MLIILLELVQIKIFNDFIHRLERSNSQRPTLLLSFACNLGLFPLCTRLNFRLMHPGTTILKMKALCEIVRDHYENISECHKYNYFPWLVSFLEVVAIFEGLWSLLICKMEWVPLWGPSDIQY